MTLSGLLKMAELAIDCAQVDLNAMTDGEWLTLKERLYEFFTAEIQWSLAPRPKPITNDQIITLGYLIAGATPTEVNDYVMNEECIEPMLALAEKKSAQWQKTLTREQATYIQEGFRRFLKAAQTEEFPDFIEFNLAELTHDWDESIGDLAPLAVARLLLYLVAGDV